MECTANDARVVAGVPSWRIVLAPAVGGLLVGLYFHFVLPGRRLLGPAECPVFRLNNLYRFHFQVQSADSAVLHEVLRNVLAVAKPPSNVEFQVDVDPFNML